MNLHESPKAIKLEKEVKAKIHKLVQELDPITRAAGVDYYMFTFHVPEPEPGIYTTSIATMDTHEAAALLADAFRTTQQLVQSQTPNAPGGQA